MKPSISRQEKDKRKGAAISGVAKAFISDVRYNWTSPPCRFFQGPAELRGSSGRAFSGQWAYYYALVKRRHPVVPL